MGNVKAFAHTQLLRYLKSLVPDSRNVARGNVLAATKEVIGEFAAAMQDQAKEIKRLRRGNADLVADITSLQDEINKLKAEKESGVDLGGDPAPEPTGVDRDEDLNEPEDDDDDLMDGDGEEDNEDNDDE